MLNVQEQILSVVSGKQLLSYSYLVKMIGINIRTC